MRGAVRTSLIVSSISLTLDTLPPDANATPFTPNVSASATVTYTNATTNAFVSSPCSNPTTLANTTVGCSGTSTTPTSGATLNYLDTATADYGVLKAGGQSSISNATGVSNTIDEATSVGSAFFEDAWVITGGTGTGTLQLQFALDGSYNFCSGGAQVNFVLIPLGGTGGSASSYNFAPVGCSGSITRTAVLSTTFTFGSPLDFLVQLQAGSVQFNLGVNDALSFWDLQDTATMNAIVVDNAAGTPIPFSLSTASGATLFSQLAPSSSPTPVPEPASFAIFGAGLAALGLTRRKRKAR